MVNSTKFALGGVTLSIFVSAAANAGTVTPGSLMTSADANQIEVWLGVGDQDFTRIWQGDAGVATSADFHSAVDGVGPTIAIYDITLGDGSMAKIGGYTAADWNRSGGSSYINDPSAFIFNLTSGEFQSISAGSLAIFRHPDYFATFGNGHDIQGGLGILGTRYGAADALHDGYSYSFAYDTTQGQITVVGDSGAGFGNSGIDFRHWSVNSLDMYTFANAAAPVPVPAGIVLLAGGIAAFGTMRRRST